METPGILNRTKRDSHQPESGAWRHALTGLVLLTPVLIFIAAGGNYLLHRPLWMDEVHTWLLVSDPDLSYAMPALRDGVDFNPPGYFLAARLWCWLTFGVSEFRLRIFSLALIVFSMVVLTRTAGRRFGIVPVTTAILFTVGNRLILHQCTEMRFYALWIAALVCLSASFEKTCETKTKGSALLTSALSFLVCTCHYFGVISVGLMLIFAVIRCRGALRRSFLPLITLLVGFSGPIVCIPFLLSQRQAVTRATWISPATLADCLQFSRETLPLFGLSAGLTAFLLSGRSRSSEKEDIRDSLWNALRTPLSAGILMSPAIILFSIIIQPSLVPRYAAVAIPAGIPLAAAALSRFGRLPTAAAFGMAAITAFLNVRSCVVQWQMFEERLSDLRNAVRDIPTGVPILFEDRADWFPLVYRYPELRSRCALVDFTDSQMTVDSDLRAVQRDSGRKIAQWYPEYQMRHLSEFSDSEMIGVVPYQGGSPHDLKYPSMLEPEQINAFAWLLVRKSENQRVTRSALDQSETNNPCFRTAQSETKQK
ncbi:MAG: hypothetical protein ACK526_23060 [Planctomyces sp.]